MPDDISTLAPSEVIAPANLEVNLLAELSPVPIRPGDTASSLVGGIYAGLTPIEMVEECFARAKQYLDKKDPMQASEKLYKTTEEAIKYLAKYYKLSEAKTAEAQGHWSTGLLGSAPKTLSANLNKPEIDIAWAKAWDVHILGFHENKYSVNQVKQAVPYIQALVDYVREVSNGRQSP